MKKKNRTISDYDSDGSDFSTVSLPRISSERVTRSMARIFESTPTPHPADDDDDDDNNMDEDDDIGLVYMKDRKDVRMWFMDNVEYTDGEVAEGVRDTGICICAEEFDGKRIVRMKCGHILCFDCFHDVFYVGEKKKKVRCPYCRKRVDSILNECITYNY